ncbi:hypothetical protein WJX73_004752 [Symbiochloris irregularis]|uniref:Uncharacterized protein n=1 Tax=Symbiochloris irregularis TaxID=706552 RepID=A0AAW1NQW2_9CHLO
MAAWLCKSAIQFLPVRSSCSFTEPGLWQLKRHRFSHCCQHRRQLHASIVAMAKPRKKAAGSKTVKIHCANCRAFLYKYQKDGKGSLVKCWHERIVEDATKDGELSCPECGTEFARPTMVKGRPANKMIGGKVTMQK